MAEIMIGIAIPKTSASQPVPRHREIKEFLAKHILKKLGVEPQAER
jgi:DNA-directed RNA polymerase subunit H (RpoH/RPB5)